MMLLSRAEFIQRMSDVGVSPEPGSPLWAYSEAHGIVDQWFIWITDRSDPNGTCYVSQHQGSWWGFGDRDSAFEALLRHG